MKGIFISYRRQDAPGHAGRLYDRLQEKFGTDRVFMDVAGSIEPGLPFDQVIQEAVGSCEVLLVVIGDEWLTAVDEKGRRRIDDENDYLRIEAATALARNIRVVPVLVSRAAMPTADELPDDLKPLAKRQAIELSDERWNFDVDRLIKVLEGVLEPKPVVVTPLVTASKPQPSRSRAMVYGVIGLLVVVLGAYGIWRGAGGGTGRRVVMPDLVGLTLPNAQRQLAAAGLGVADLTYEETRESPKDTVIRQAPDAGSRTNAGDGVKLLVAAEPKVASNGGTPTSPQGRPAGSSTSNGQNALKVPDLEGKSPDEARKIATDLGVSLKFETLVTSSSPLNQVVRQLRRPGTPMEKGSVIRVVVSERTGLAAGERMRGFRYFAVGDSFVLDPDGTSARTPSLVLREGSAVVSKTLRTAVKDGLYLAPADGVRISLLTVKEPTYAACVDAIKTPKVDLAVVPVEKGEIYCVATRAGTVGAVYTRVVQPPDQDKDRALIGYWIWNGSR